MAKLCAISTLQARSGDRGAYYVQVSALPPRMEALKIGLAWETIISILGTHSTQSKIGGVIPSEASGQTRKGLATLFPSPLGSFGMRGTLEFLEILHLC